MPSGLRSSPAVSLQPPEQLNRFQYVRNGRDLAQFAHYDYLLQAFLQAAIFIFNSYPETIPLTTFTSSTTRALQNFQNLDPFGTLRTQPRRLDWASGGSRSGSSLVYQVGGCIAGCARRRMAAASTTLSMDRPVIRFYEFIEVPCAAVRYSGDWRSLSAASGLCGGLSIAPVLSSAQGRLLPVRRS